MNFKKLILLLLLSSVTAAFVLYNIQKRLIFSDNKKDILFSFKIVNDKYLLSCSDNKVYVYSENGELFCQYELRNEIILSSSISDLDKDNKDEIILLTSTEISQYGDDLVVLSFDHYEENNATKSAIVFKEIYRNHCKDLNPWKVQTSDVDGDKKSEISLGVYKTSPLHPIMAKRPFIYDWVNGGIFPKWRGSRLSRPFDDYVFLDLDSDGRDEIVSIEYTPNGSKVLASYSWKGFGFEKTGESKNFKDISSLQVELIKGQKTNVISAEVKENTVSMKKTFYYLEGKILIKE